MAVIVSKQIVVPVRGKRASDYAVGDIVKLRENGVPVEYLVVHQGLPGAMYDASCDGTWVLRKDCAENRQWNSADVNDYERSTINAYLNGDWLNRFDAATKAAIKQVKIPYRPGSGASKVCNTGASGLSVKGFLLSAEETSFNFEFIPIGEGAELAYFKGCADIGGDNKRLAQLNGNVVFWWLRSPYCHPSGSHTTALLVYSNGGWYFGGATQSYALRPTHILRSDTLFDSNNILKG